MKIGMKFIGGFILVLLSTPLFAWGTTGHRIVAEIAENHLSHKTKREIKKIIGDQKLAYWANWGDFVKSNPDYKFADSWHYNNFPAGSTRAEFDSILQHSSPENLYKRTLLLCEQLKNRDNISQKQKEEALFFLIHIFGDAHQPLHIGREDDLGGNKIEVKWFKDKTNLHSLWDSKLIDFQNYSYTEYAQVLDVHSKEENKKLTAGSFEDWLYDSYQNAELIYNNVKAEDELRFKYDYQYVGVLESQLLKGGLRLAKLLNEVFG